MSRITKGQIQAAQLELGMIKELASDSFNGPHACYQFHAPSASRHIDTLVKANHPLPTWLVEGARYFKAMGWSVPSQAGAR